MWVYEKKLQFPVKIQRPNAQIARVIYTALGGPDGELGAANRYLSQRYTAPDGRIKGILTDIGTEELSHVEMVSSLLFQLTRNLSVEEIKEGGYDTYFVDHTTAIYPTGANGMPFSAGAFAVKGDILADLTEDLAAEQKARVSYDNILRLTDDPDVKNVIRFLREREVVHYQRCGEALSIATDLMDKSNIYAYNIEFDNK